MACVREWLLCVLYVPWRLESGVVVVWRLALSGCGVCNLFFFLGDPIGYSGSGDPIGLTFSPDRVLVTTRSDPNLKFFGSGRVKCPPLVEIKN
ncbi:hypothetical protein CISIN_1g034513mg [Citrus sinensis]|uniref:Uncharacterized protein n=1 Tax=Citrus sinensis TaxID=2711 RepID=A0A067DSE0_CITSI|nr:hypothetical protein CISIN_1g034513mg [Citrus sinensis]